MKKRITLLALSACISVAHAESQINRLTTKTPVSSQWLRGIDSTGTFSASQPAATDVTNAQAKVDNNASLSALSSSYAGPVVRMGYAAAGDAPPVVYTLSGSACSLNAGTAVRNWNVQGNRIFGANVTLAPTAASTGLNFNSNWIQGTISITGAASSYGSFTSNHFYGNTTFAGAWARLSLCGNDVISGTYSVTATGAVARCDPGYTWNTGGQPLTTNAISNSAGIYLAGSTPTCSVPSGGGTGVSCAFSGGSNANVGTVSMTAGSTASATGTMTVTFSTTFAGTSTPVCGAGYDDTGTAWNAGAIAPKVSAVSTSAVTFTWNNNAVALTNGSTYRIMYHCFGK